MMHDRMLRIDGDSHDGGIPAVAASLRSALEGARAGLVTRAGPNRFVIGREVLIVDLMTDRHRRIPEDVDMADIARQIVDSIDRPIVTAASLRVLHEGLGGIAAFADTDQVHVVVRTATPWRTAYACGCPCPMRSGKVTATHWHATVECAIDPGTEALLPDVVVAGLDGTHLRLQAYSWGGSHDPYVHDMGDGTSLRANGIPDAMTALRALEALRAARNVPPFHGNDDARSASDG